MTLLDHLARLEKLADAATPGPYIHKDPNPGEAQYFSLVPAGEKCGSLADFYNYADGQDRANRDYFAALDPDTVRGLLAVARAAEKFCSHPTHGQALDSLEEGLADAVIRLGKAVGP